MANQFYTQALSSFMRSEIHLVNDTISALLVRTTGTGTGPYYTLDIDTDQFLSDIPNNSDCRPAPKVDLSGVSVIDGVFDADDISFPSVSAGDDIQAVVLYKDTGVPSTSRLIAYFDTGSSGFPFTADGTNINVFWDVLGVFAL